MHWLGSVCNFTSLHLQGRKVLITPNTKPGKEIIASLVKAVDGQVCNPSRLFLTANFTCSSISSIYLKLWFVSFLFFFLLL